MSLRKSVKATLLLGSLIPLFLPSPQTWLSANILRDGSHIFTTILGKGKWSHIIFHKMTQQIERRDRPANLSAIHPPKRGHLVSHVKGTGV